MKNILRCASLTALVLFLGATSCSQDPTPLCENGEQQCNTAGTLAYECLNNRWLIKEDCAELAATCEMKASQAVCSCAEGTFTCSEDSRSVRVCASGAWEDQETCSEGDVCNFDGVAEAYSCMPADLACDPTRERERCRVVATSGDPNAKYTADAYTCAIDGKWTLKTACSESQVCIMKLASAAATEADPLLKEVAVCEPFPCQEGVEYCPAGSATGNPHTCENGVLVKKDTCAPGTACVINRDGAAVCIDWRCTPGQESCNTGGDAIVCDETERTVLKEDCTAQQACVYMNGVASCVTACTAGEQQCSSKAEVQTCGADRLWETTTVCEAGSECVVYDGAASCRVAE